MKPGRESAPGLSGDPGREGKNKPAKYNAAALAEVEAEIARVERDPTLGPNRRREAPPEIPRDGG